MSSEALTDLLRQELTRPAPPARPGSNGLRHWSERDRGELLDDALQADPGDVAHWYRLADHWLDKGNFVRAAGLMGQAIARFPDAGGAYARRAEALIALDPAQSKRDAAQAVKLGCPPPPPPLEVLIDTPAAKDQVAPIYADITDMIAYLTHNMSMSGIQRVTANMLRCAMDRTSPNARDVIPVVPDYINKVVYTADVGLVRELMDAVELRKPNRKHLDRLLETIQSSLRAIDPAPGSIILLAGAFWIVHSYDLLKQLRQQGVVVGLFIHDLIQIDNPEFVHKEATESFLRSLLDVAEVASFFTTNSAFVAREVRRFLARETGLDTPVYPVPLATEMRVPAAQPLEDAGIRAEFGDAGYALCVCTIEVRKNHIFLVRIWERLLREGRTDLPKLVFIGKWGWDVGALRDVLERTNYLDGMVLVMNDVPDSRLASLYRNSRFTLYPSFAEGWGLPIGESLVFGKPCIAAGVTSMPEVGGALVRYVDPLDVEGGIALVRGLLDNPAELDGWTRQVATKFKPRRWSDFAEQLLGASRALAKRTAGQPRAFARIRPGERATVDDDDVRLAADAGRSVRSARMARDYGWLALEEKYGAWADSPLATLRFIADGCAPGERLRVIVYLHGEYGQPLPACQLTTNVQTTAFRELEIAPSPHAVEAEVDRDGVVEIAILTRGGPIRMRKDKVYAGFSGLGYHRRDNADEALDLMEVAAFGR